MPTKYVQLIKLLIGAGIFKLSIMQHRISTLAILKKKYWIIRQISNLKLSPEDSEREYELLIKNTLNEIRLN